MIMVALTCVGCHHSSNTEGSREQEEIVEDNPVLYPGRSIKYADKFRDNNKKHLAAAAAIGLKSRPKNREEAEKMRKQLKEIHTTKNYIIDDLTHSTPHLVPKAAAELDSIGAGFAAILARNGLPHYRFRVTSVLRTEEDIKKLQKSGNVNSVSNSAHCYGTTLSPL